MFRPAHYVARLVVGASALLLTGSGGAAFASVSPPDPGLSAPPSPVPLVAAPTGWQELHWMLSGAGAMVLLAGAVLLATLVSRRHLVRARRAGLRRELGLG